MTQQELYDTWVRYMHRNDLQQDMATTYALAGNEITNRLLYAAPDLAEILATEPQLYVHAGLLALAEIAQDDEQMARSEGRLQRDLQAWSLRHSIDTSDGVATSPSYGGTA